MLAVRNLSVELSGRPILDGLDFDLAPGEVVGLIGPNGAGKSTLMRAVAGLVPHSGAIEIAGRPASAFDARELARHVAFLPQARAIAWPLSVRNVVLLGRAPWRGWGAINPHDRAIADRAMHLMEVDALAERPVTELSGGEQARVLAARAIAQETPLLIADEPTAGLDPAHEIGFMAAIRNLAKDGRTVLLSIHNLTLAARWCDRLILISDGRIHGIGSPADTLTSGTLDAVFGIEAAISADACGLVLAPTGLARRRQPETRSE